MPNYWCHHVHLISRDPSKTAEFYESMFGAKRTGVRQLEGGGTIINLDLHGMGIFVMSPRSKPLTSNLPQTGYALEHFGLRTDDLDTAVKELKKKGVKFIMDIMEVNPSLKTSFFIDPENVPVELLETAESAQK